ncbi:acid protease [Chiua virens]|nr:acid protease [Chiua virens]
MLASKALLSLIFLVLSVADATPINGTGTLNIVEKDRARAQAFRQAAHPGKRSTSFSVTNAAVTYTAQVGVGSPATDYTLLIDTGSSNTWIGASTAYQNTGIDTGNTVYLMAPEASLEKSGLIPSHLLPDWLSKANPSELPVRPPVLVALMVFLGVGPVTLTSGTVSNTNTVPTVSDNLLSQGTISEEVLGIYYVPAAESTSTGTLTFGGVDDSAVTGSVHYASLTTTSPATNYWGIDQSITYGGEIILSMTAGIVDTGTTLILIASDAFQKYQSATGATSDSTTGLLTISSSQYSALKPLSFNVGDQTFTLSANAQIWPRSLNSAIGGTSGSIYLVVGDIGSSSGSGLDFINGYTFLERYYSVFDTTNGRVGFATTAYTTATSN